MGKKMTFFLLHQFEIKKGTFLLTPFYTKGIFLINLGIFEYFKWYRKYLYTMVCDFFKFSKTTNGQLLLLLDYCVRSQSSLVLLGVKSKKRVNGCRSAL